MTTASYSSVATRDASAARRVSGASVRRTRRGDRKACATTLITATVRCMPGCDAPRFERALHSQREPGSWHARERSKVVAESTAQSDLVSRTRSTPKACRGSRWPPSSMRRTHGWLVCALSLAIASALHPPTRPHRSSTVRAAGARDGTTDVVVVGSGIGGLSAAALLSTYGYKAQS